MKEACKRPAASHPVRGLGSRAWALPPSLPPLRPAGSRLHGRLAACLCGVGPARHQTNEHSASLETPRIGNNTWQCRRKLYLDLRERHFIQDLLRCATGRRTGNSYLSRCRGPGPPSGGRRGGVGRDGHSPLPFGHRRRAVTADRWAGCRGGGRPSPPVRIGAWRPFPTG